MWIEKAGDALVDHFHFRQTGPGGVKRVSFSVMGNSQSMCFSFKLNISSRNQQGKSCFALLSNISRAVNWARALT